MQQKVDTVAELKADPIQWQARVDLAAAHRIAFMQDFHEGIFNHFTLTVPGTDDRYYQLPFGLHWSEVKASDFMEVGFDGQVLRGSGEVERSCYAIHAPIHRKVPQAACVLHTHMPFASALTRLEDPRIKPIGQIEAALMTKIAYDMDFNGPAATTDEGERLADLFGSKNVLFMGNHGITTVGRSVAEAYDLLYYLERAAQVQLYAMWTGKPLKLLDQNVIDTTMRNYTGQKYLHGKACDYHFSALKRMLDRKEPDYQE